MKYLKETRDFHFLRPLNSDLKTYGDEVLYIVGQWSEELEWAITASKVKHIVISTWSGWDLRILSRFSPQIEELWIEDRTIGNASSISDLKRLRSLYLAGSNKLIDFRNLACLKKCTLLSERIEGNINQCRDLEELILTGIYSHNLRELVGLKLLKSLEIQSGRLGTLAGIESLVNLEHLCLRQVNIKHLSGIEHLHKLRELTLLYLRALTSLEPIGKLTQLKRLDIESCSQIKSLREICSVKNLRELVLEMKSIDSLKPLQVLQSLEKLILCERTNVLDGDVNCLLRFPKLKTVGFKNRRHYTHNLCEIQSQLTSLDKN